MDAEHAVVLLASLGLLVVAVALVLASPVIIGGEGNGIQETRLADFETSEPFCGEGAVPNGTATSEEIAGGERLFVNRTVPVAGPDSTLDASIDTWGAGHHTLQITRDAGNRTGDCPYRIRFNATVEFARADDWTLLVTYDDELVGAHWRDDGTGGSFDSEPDPAPPVNESEAADGAAGSEGTETATSERVAGVRRASVG